ncbi:MAG: TRAP transporter small permease [Aestuariivita sp.]|nr:TRAP transporter small permease [Aestuariivita sp.]
MIVLKWLERYFEELICCVCISIIAIAVFSQVVARYIFEIALHWTEETAAICMVWAVYMGASLCVRERFHIRIMIAVQALPIRFGKIIIITADLFWAFFCLLMIRVGWDYLFVFWRFTETSPSLGINQFYPQTILVIGYILILLRLIQTYFLWHRNGRSGLPGLLEEEWTNTK